MRQAQLNNDLGNPIFHNLREGFWLLDYHINRLKKRGDVFGPLI
jgi:hypothetical protein